MQDEPHNVQGTILGLQGNLPWQALCLLDAIWGQGPLLFQVLLPCGNLAQGLEPHSRAAGVYGINYGKAGRSHRVIFERSSFFFFLEGEFRIKVYRKTKLVFVILLLLQCQRLFEVTSKSLWKKPVRWIALIINSITRVLLDWGGRRFLQMIRKRAAEWTCASFSVCLFRWTTLSSCRLLLRFPRTFPFPQCDWSSETTVKGISPL